MSRRDELALLEYLDHIRQAVDRIQRYAATVDQAAFFANEEKQDAVVRNLEIIGEAAGCIRSYFPEFEANHPDLPLKAAYGTRNALVRGYFKIDLNIVWKTITTDLPTLKAQVNDAIHYL